ncbi:MULTISPECIES: sensor histidine kinase [Catenuloplanes]|uniref:histidine kinase n=1 Tax=Catenuloplanes niger TaxID=587534 RepID=A0AAE3ZZR9_9ACTN|nr:HAMP domain-containing sensor histidine kinase [Catenuloplanes niger]MDR7327816.1 signal transduction histidine kinase [Catenuloplanes niger]
MSVPVRRDGWTVAERRAVSRARRQIGLLAGLVVAGLVALVGGVSYALLVQGQHVQIRRELHWNAQHGVPSGPPGCTWLILLSGGALDTGAVPPPPGFPLRDALDAVAGSGRAQEVTVARNGTVYVVLTERRGADTVQAVFDTRYQLADRRLLLRALGVAESIGLVTAVLTGLFVGGRSVAPLADALSRQRRFVADASHELRTPIARVHTRAQLMARRPALPPEHRTDLDRLIGNTRLLGEIVDDLLLSARLGADDRLATASRIDLAALARDAVSQDAERAAARGITLVADGVAAPLAVPGIPSALRRVVSELVGNALAHTPPGGTVLVRATTSGGTAVLEVADTGQGLAPADTERLFHRFHRGTSTRPGFGIGLALVREVVEKHGGTVRAAGRPGEGATFTVRLPLA